MSARKGFTLTELIVCVGALAIGAFLLAEALTGEFSRTRSPDRRGRCRSNLNQLAKGMATYLNEFGDNRFYPWLAGRPGCGTVANPNFTGAAWLASLYWTQIIPDWGVFLCPSSDDNNDQGKQLGSSGTPGGRPLSAHAVSYAGMNHLSVGAYLTTKLSRPSSAGKVLAIRDDFPPNEPMASDDTEEPINHGERDNGGMAVLFFDSHVEYWTHTRVDLEHGVGQGELCALRN